MNKDKTCTISGLRPHKLPGNLNILLLSNRIESEIRKSVSLDYTTFQTGMAIGVDIWASETVLELRKELPAVKLVCYQPCETQANEWTKSWREKYFSVLAQADEVICLQEHYSGGCMQRRNRKMIDHSSRLIAVYDNESRGGTSRTIDYARKQKLEIIIINPLVIY